MIEQSRGATSAVAVSNLAGTRRDDNHPEFRIGRIKHERIKVCFPGKLTFASKRFWKNETFGFCICVQKFEALF